MVLEYYEVFNMEVASELIGIAFGCVKERNNGK